MEKSGPELSPRGNSRRAPVEQGLPTGAAERAILITFPPSLDCELARFLLTYYGIPYEERRHAFGFNFFATLWHARTLHFPLVVSRAYKLDTVRKMIDYFDPMCPASRKLLPDGPDRTLVEADWTAFNGTLGGATAVFAYHHLLPHREIMIRPLSEGTPPFEALTVRWGYAVYASVLRKLLGLSDDTAAAALTQIRSAAQTVDDRLADGRRYLIGDRFTLSDMAFAEALAPLVLADTYGGPLPTFAELPSVMKAVTEELRARPAGEFALRIYRDYRSGTR
jgi:glutathione S-transferase